MSRLKSLCIQIGNSDNKLTQEKWSNFCNDLIETCNSYENIKVHFCASSLGHSLWQNFCIIIEVDDAVIFWLKKDLDGLRCKYNQDSIAILEGYTDFISSKTYRVKS